MNPSKFLEKRLSAALEKQPGWIYVGLAVYLGVWFSKLPWLPQEIWVVVLTPLLYWIGDGVDSARFRLPNKTERYPQLDLDDKRKKARDSLEIQDGVYDVAFKLLAEAGEGRHRALVNFQNECAKFLRSIALPIAVLGIYLGVRFSPAFFGLVIALPLLVRASFHLKLLHMRTLYSLVPWHCGQHGYAVHDLPQSGTNASRIRLFFWEGKLIASATHEPVAANRTGTAVLVAARPSPLAQFEQGDNIVTVHRAATRRKV
jgi:hypothetical protein